MTTPEPSAAAPGGASDLIRILDAYLADLRAGKAPDRAALLAAHPDFAQQLESCLAALDFIHRTERPDPTVPPTLGDFRIVREIGRGAWGVVYEAEQISLNRRVALKVLRFGGPADAAAMERFQREAETIAGLHHTNIMPIFAVGCENGVHYFAMQLIAGRGLDAVLKEAKDQNRPLDAKAVCGWGVQAAEALAHAHARGVVHRDVKPSNLLLDGAGIVWLADFGLARRQDETAMTLAGVAVGTPRYMSPEQLAAAQQPVDQRSDVYSLGATLYELATGRAVFVAQTREELYRQIAEVEPESPRTARRDLPRDLETVLLTCLAKEPSRRYATAQELADDLRRVVNGDPIKARRPNVLLRLRRWATKQSRGSLVAAGVVVTTAVVLAGLVLGIEAYREGKKGQLQIDTDGTLMRVEVLTRGGEPVMEPFTITTDKTISLPRGWYRVRVSSPGALSADYEVLVETEELRTVSLSPRKVDPLNPSGELASCDIVRLRDRDDILLTQIDNSTRERKITLVDAITHKTIWELPPDITKAIPGTGDWSRQDYPFKAIPGTDVWLRQDHHIDGQDYPFNNKTLESGTLVQPAPSLQTKGLGDLLWAEPSGRLGPAISGKDGSVLWPVLGPDRVPVVPRFRSILGAAAGPVSVGNYRAAELHGDLACRPLLVDVDGDGLPDVVALFAAVLEDGQLRAVHEHERPLPTNRVVWAFLLAVKGNTGEELWRYDFPTKESREGTATIPERFATYLTRINNRQAILVRADKQVVAIDACKGVPVSQLSNVGYFEDGEWYPTTDGRGLLIVRVFSGLVNGDGHGASHRSAGDLSQHRWPRVDNEEWGSGNKGKMDEWRILRNRQLITPTDILCAEYFEHSKHSVEISSFDIEQGKVLWTERLTRWAPNYNFDSALHTALLPTHRDDPRDGPRGCYLTAYFIPGEMYGHAPNSIYLLTAANLRSSGQLLGRRLQPLPGDPPPRFSKMMNLGVLGDTSRFQGKIRWLPVGANQPPYLAVNYRDLGINSGAVRPKNTLSTYLFGAEGQLRHVWPDVYAIGAADFAGDGRPYLYGVHRTGTGSIALDIAPLGPREIWRRPGCWSSYEADEANEGQSFWSIGRDYRAEYLCPPSLGGDFLFVDYHKDTTRRISGEDGTLLWQSKIVPSRLAADPYNSQKVICRCVRLNQKEYLAIKTGSHSSSSILLNAQSGERIPEPLPSLPDAEPANTGLRPQVMRRGSNVGDIKDSIEWNDQNNRVVWRCAGPGLLSGILPPVGTGKPPSALFIVYSNRRPYTVCLEALPAGDTPPVLDFGPNATEPLRVTLPWVVPGKQGLTRAAWSGLISMGIVLFFAFRRKIVALGIFAWFLCFPAVAGAILLTGPVAGGRRREYSDEWQLMVLVVESAVFILGLIAWRWSVARCQKKNLGLHVMSLLGVPVLLSVLLPLIGLMDRPLDDPFDWSGWYLLWPYAYSSFDPWLSFFANPLSWVAIWVAWRVARWVLEQGEDPRIKVQKR